MKLSPVYEISLAEKVSMLKQPATYPHPAGKITSKETHMSWVFLVNNHVYKLKKPVQYRLLDFRALDARLHNCREEIRLNKRLAAHIYEGVVPLVITDTRNMQVEGKGQVIEWLVKMKRIEQENLLDHAILHKKVNEKDLEKAASLLATFYKMSLPVPIQAHCYQQKLILEITGTQKELLNPQYHLPAQQIDDISDHLVQFIKTRWALFEKRISAGKIIDAHGDLRPEHICLAPQPAIIDALEFNSDLRIMDIAEELAFLEMECEMIGDLVTGQQFIACYEKISKDEIPPALRYFFKTKKALLRTWLVARHITESGYQAETKWMIRANAYLKAAQKYYNQLSTCTESNAK